MLKTLIKQFRIAVWGETLMIHEASEGKMHSQIRKGQSR